MQTRSVVLERRRTLFMPFAVASSYLFSCDFYLLSLYIWYGTSGGAIVVVVTAHSIQINICLFRTNAEATSTSQAHRFHEEREANEIATQVNLSRYAGRYLHAMNSAARWFRKRRILLRRDIFEQTISIIPCIPCLLLQHVLSSIFKIESMLGICVTNMCRAHQSRSASHQAKHQSEPSMSFPRRNHDFEFDSDGFAIVYIGDFNENFGRQNARAGLGVFFGPHSSLWVFCVQCECSNSYWLRIASILFSQKSFCTSDWTLTIE